jgi:Ca2+-binding RTX toxin-like protein
MPAPIKWSLADFELVNAESPEGEPWLAAAPDGRFTLTFFESFAGPPAYTDIETRLYSAAGADTGLGVAPTFSASTIDHQAASAYLPDGRQVFVWTEESAAGGGNLEDVYALLYVGTLVSVPRFLVAGGAGIQHDPVVAASASGGFAIALADDIVAGGRVTLKFYNAVGTLVNTVLDASAPEGVYTPPGVEDDYRNVEITGLANGNYVVTWSDDANFDIFARIFSAGGVALTGLIDIEPGGSSALWPDVTALADGRFLVTYEQTTVSTVRGHIYEANGTSAIGPFTISTSAASTNTQQVQSAALADGRFVTVYRNLAGNIEGQVMFADGTPDGGVFAVNSDAAGDKGRPTVATLADGRFAVSWESGAGATATIFSTIFDPREQRISQSASSLNDDWYGTSFSDTMFMGNGNDTVHGAGAADFIFGEAGNDTIFGEDSDDRINGGNGIDTMIGGVGNDIYWVNSASDVTTELAGEGIDTVRSTVSWTLAAEVDKLYLDGSAANGTGNALVNFMFGNAQNNILDGQGGADRMNGGAGNDTYIVDSAGDLVFETIAGAAGGIADVVSSSVNHTLSANVEILGLSGVANVNATGNTLINGIFGNTGNNFIDGKAGNDSLSGGGGSDQFLFTTALNATTNVDTISDFDPANDFLRLDDAIFTQIAPGFLAANGFEVGTGADDINDRIIYNFATGEVFYDRDGLGGVAQVKFAVLTGAPALTAADIFVF